MKIMIISLIVMVIIGLAHTAYSQNVTLSDEFIEPVDINVLNFSENEKDIYLVQIDVLSDSLVNVVNSYNPILNLNVGPCSYQRLVTLKIMEDIKRILPKNSIQIIQTNYFSNTQSVNKKALISALSYSYTKAGADTRDYGDSVSKQNMCISSPTASPIVIGYSTSIIWDKSGWAYWALPLPEFATLNSVTVTVRGKSCDTAVTYVARLKMKLSNGEWSSEIGKLPKSYTEHSLIIPSTYLSQIVINEGGKKYIMPIVESEDNYNVEWIKINITYTEPTYSLTVNLTPSNGRWRVDDRSWRNSGNTETGLSKGNHTIYYEDSVSGWKPPNNENIYISSNTTLSRNYEEIKYNLTVNLNLSNGRWKVDDRSWRNSGYKEPGLSKGNHTIYYESVSGWKSPKNGSETIYIVSDEILSRDYIQYGTINGSILTNSGKPIQGVQVCTSTGNNCTTTDADGKYSIKNIDYGTSTTFTLTPKKDNHVFQPQSKSVTLSTNQPSANDISFTDISGFTINGNITFQNTNCPVVDVHILVDGKETSPVTVTGKDGSFQINVEIGSHTITPQLKDHTFNPASITKEINSNISEVNFTDTKTYSLSGKIVGGCGYTIGVSTINITDTSGCYSNNISTDNSGNYSINLPPQNYIITARNSSKYYEKTQNIDLRSGNIICDFIYNSPIEIRFSGFAEISGKCQIPIMKQGEKYDIVISIFEKYGENICQVENGEIIIFDEIGDKVEQQKIDFKNGTATYSIIAGEPNIISPFKKHLEVTVSSGERTAKLDQWVIVTGHKPRSQTFTTVTPELPLIILRDPQGDISYSYLSKSTSYGITTSLGFEYEGSIDVYSNAKIEAKFAGLGLKGNIGGSLEVGGGIIGQEEIGLIFSTETTFMTSQIENISGSTGDVYGGAAINLIYAITDVLEVDENCQPYIKQSIAWKGDGFKTNYLYTENHIEQVIIPELINTGKIESAELWKNILDLNKKLKSEATFITNRSFSAGSETKYSETTTINNSVSINFYMFIKKEVAIGAGLNYGLGSVEGEVKVKSNLKLGASLNEKNINTNAIGYSLGDNDPGDSFSIDICKDNIFGTPVFKLVSGRSSCPWEPFTIPRDGVKIKVEPNVLNDIPSNTKAQFNLTLENISQTDEERTYYLSVVQESNPNGAIISVGGVIVEGFLKYTIPASDSKTATMTVERGPDAYEYKDLKLVLYSPCDPDKINSMATFSVNFKPPYTAIAVNITNKQTTNPLQGVKISVIKEGVNIISSISNEKGECIISDVSVYNNYTIVAEKVGYLTVEKKYVSVIQGPITSLNIEMTPSDVPAPKLTIDIPETVQAGSFFWADIKAKDVQDLYGLSFVQNWTQGSFLNVKTPISTTIIQGDFLGNDIIFYPTLIENESKISIGMSRKSGQTGSNGSGVLVRIQYILSSNIPIGTKISFNLSEINANKSDGTELILTTVDAITVVENYMITVWPGDTNNDGLVNQTDILPIGLYWNKTGSNRQNASNIWKDQPCNSWTIVAATYADANGDGIISQADILPIGFNWGQTHEKATKIAASIISSGSIQPVPKVNELPKNAGVEFWIEIKVENVSALFGLSFVLTYDKNDLIEPLSAESGTFLGSDILFFPQIEGSNDRVAIGMSQKAGQSGANGSGTVAIIKFKTSQNITAAPNITLTLSDVVANNQTGESIILLVKEGQIGMVGVDEKASLPEKVKLLQNFPNPFNPITTITFSLPVENYVRLDIYDVQGKRISTLLDERLSAGIHSVDWYAGEYSSGIYIYRITAGSFIDTKKMLFMK